jgi:hypothetical protein
LNKKEILLYLISKSGVIRGKTRIQKIVFLLQREKGFPLRYTFYPYQQGPLSFELIEDLNSLISSGLVIESISETQYGPRYDYRLSNIGNIYVEKIVEGKLNQIEKAKVQSVINRWNYIDLEKLLDYVHRKYPELQA